MNYENQKECHLMIWEQDPNKRNVNNEIKFNIPSTIKIEVGDQIRCRTGGAKFSCYEITEIIEIKPSSISNFSYITAKTKWGLN